MAAAKIERFDAINKQILSSVDAQLLEVDDPLNTLACMLFDSDALSEVSIDDDADFIIDIVSQYLALISDDVSEQKKIVKSTEKIITEN